MSDARRCSCLRGKPEQQQEGDTRAHAAVAAPRHAGPTDPLLTNQQRPTASAAAPDTAATSAGSPLHSFLASHADDVFADLDLAGLEVLPGSVEPQTAAFADLDLTGLEVLPVSGGGHASAGPSSSTSAAEGFITSCGSGTAPLPPLPPPPVDEPLADEEAGAELEGEGADEDDDFVSAAASAVLTRSANNRSQRGGEDGAVAPERSRQAVVAVVPPLPPPPVSYNASLAGHKRRAKHRSVSRPSMPPSSNAGVGRGVRPPPLPSSGIAPSASFAFGSTSHPQQQQQQLQAGEGASAQAAVAPRKSVMVRRPAPTAEAHKVAHTMLPVSLDPGIAKTGRDEGWMQPRACVTPTPTPPQRRTQVGPPLARVLGEA